MFSSEVNLLLMASMAFSSTLVSVKPGKNLPVLLFRIHMMKMLQKMEEDCFIVDSYHYTNHHATNELCRKYYNPAPTDGSGPNLVGQKVDKNGVVHDVREFKTQTCEQLNAWLGGFETILKWMTSKNFNWFMHVMLFYYVKHVLSKKSVRSVTDNQDDVNDSEDEESDSSSEEE